MEISKKQFALYTAILLILAGGSTVVFARQPGDAGPLWERLWKVEEPITIEGTVELASNSIVIDEPVSVDDNLGSLTVDDGDGSITVDTGDTPLMVDGTVSITGTVELAEGTEVSLADPIVIDAELTLAPGTEVRIPGEVITVFEGTLNKNNPPVPAYYNIDPKDVSGYKKLYIYVENDISFGLQYTWDLLNAEGTKIRSVSDDPIEYLDAVDPEDACCYCIELDVVANGIEFRLWRNQITDGEVCIHIYASPV